MELQLNFVAHRDTERAYERNLRFEIGQYLIHRIRMNGHEPEASALIEAERVQVVVGGDQPDAVEVLVPRD